MHILNLPTRLNLGPGEVIEPGEYVLDDVSAAQMLLMAGGGAMNTFDVKAVIGDTRRACLGLWPSSWAPPASILFMRAGGFGDLVLLTPVLRAAKAKWPDAVIAVCTMNHYAPVLTNLPFVDEVVKYPITSAALETYDAWVFYENAIERNPRAQEIHMTELFAEIAGIPSPPDLKPEYRVKPSEALWAEAEHPRTPRRRVCVQMGASAPARRYPASHFGMVCAALAKMGWEVFLLGAKGEFPPLKNALPDGIRNLMEDDLTFRQSAAVLNGSDAFIGNDSALLHVAGALGVPAVGLYGPFPWKLRTAHCPTTVALSGVGPCAPCFHHRNEMLHDNFPEQCPTKAKGICGVLADIKPERVTATVERIARVRTTGVNGAQ